MGVFGRLAGEADFLSAMLPEEGAVAVREVDLVLEGQGVNGNGTFPKVRSLGLRA
jgi:hypothetical protein